MDSHNHQKTKDKVEVKQSIDAKQKQEAPQPPASTTVSPPSPASSPSHEFSFTISLHPQTTSRNVSRDDNKSTIDLSPADDIFFHGHLLPLHLLSHLPVSPRTSTNSLGSFTLPIHQEKVSTTPLASATGNTATSNVKGTNGRAKSKTFSIFSLPRWRKWGEEEKENAKKKVRFEVSHAWKKYTKMFRPFLSFGGSNNRRGTTDTEFRRQSYSFSGRFSSAPASIRTSPVNSGHFVVKSGTVSPVKSTNDSTMEELQAAIQAAIAHCKNSCSMAENNKSPMQPIC